MKRFVLLLFPCLAGLAAPITYTVTGTFDNGKSLTGMFDFDPATKTVSKWNLTGAFAYAYTPADSTFLSGQCCTDQFEFIFTTNANILTLAFAFNPDLTPSVTTAAIAGGGETFTTSPERPGTTYSLVSGSVVSGSGSGNGDGGDGGGSGGTVPEPGTAMLVLAGLLGLAPVRRFRLS